MLIRFFSRMSTFPLWKKVLCGLFLGAVFGILAGQRAQIFSPLGRLFLNGIHMMVAPVVFVAITTAVLAVDDMKAMRRSGFRALVVYMITMMIAAVIGVTVALLLHPGMSSLGVIAHPVYDVAQHHHQSFGDAIASLIPSSPIMALANEHVLQIVVFAFIFGLSIRFAGEKGRPVAEFMKSLSVVVNKLAHIVISFAPYGVFALIASTFGHYGVTVIVPLSMLVVCVYLGCLAQCFLVYVPIIHFYLNVSPRTFFKSASSALVLAFTTSSSAATLPVTIQCAEEGLSVPGPLARFLIPLGASFNLNGLSIYLSVAAVFAAQLYGIHLTTHQLLTIALTIITTALGAAAIPGSALIVMGAVLTSVNIPLGALALIAGVDRLNDMAQTTVNVAGDIFSAMMVSKHQSNRK